MTFCRFIKNEFYCFVSFWWVLTNAKNIKSSFDRLWIIIRCQGIKVTRFVNLTHRKWFFIQTLSSNFQNITFDWTKEISAYTPNSWLFEILYWIFRCFVSKYMLNNNLVLQLPLIFAFWACKLGGSTDINPPIQLLYIKTLGHELTMGYNQHLYNHVHDTFP